MLSPELMRVEEEVRHCSVCVWGAGAEELGI